ncbi:hypothetical protein OSI63_25405, partial [Mycobacterium ulcerans]
RRPRRPAGTATHQDAAASAGPAVANHASGGADCGSSPAGPAVSAGASSAQQPSGVAAVAAGTPGAAGSADSAGATTAAVPEEQRGLTARPACTAADAAGAAV